MNNKIIEIEQIQNRIFTIRGLQVMLDSDLAEMYQVPTKRLTEQVKRNTARFPKCFRFQLTLEEKNELVANCDRFNSLKHSTVLPHAFTEQGVAMLSAVLRSEAAVKISVHVMQAFVEMRKFISTNASLFSRLNNVEQKLISLDIKHLESDQNFERLFKAIEDKSLKPKQGIFYDGQIFDAYIFVANLVKTAKSSIVLIDNYVDETVLQLFSKRDKNVVAIIYTKNISKTLKLDLQKYNSQFEKIEIKEFNNSHDRFLIIDETSLYHFGASLKDLGKKWFAFSKMAIDALEVLQKINL